MNGKQWFGVLAFLLVFAFMASAQEEVVNSENTIIPVTDVSLEETPSDLPGESLIADTGGTGPGNILYGLDKALDNLSLTLTFDKHARARKALQIARERFLEAKTAASAGNESGSTEALAEAETLETQVEQTIADLPVESASSGTSAETENTVDLEADLIEHNFVRSMVLQRVREKLVNRPGQAVQAIDRVLTQLNNLDQQFGVRKKALEEKLTAKKEALKQNLIEKTGKSSEEVDQLLDQVKDRRLVNQRLKEQARVQALRARQLLALSKRRLNQTLADDNSLLTETTNATSDIESLVSDIGEDSTMTSEDTIAVEQTSEEANAFADQVNAFVLELNALRERCRSLTGAEQESCLQLLVQKKQAFQERMRERHVQVLENVLDKIPDTAKPALTRVVDRAKERLENINPEKLNETLRTRIANTLQRRADRANNIAERVENRSDAISDRIENRSDKISDRLENAADRMRDQGKDRAADKLDQQSNRVERAGDRIADRVENRGERVSDRLNEREENLRNRAKKVQK